MAGCKIRELWIICAEKTILSNIYLHFREVYSRTVAVGDEAETA